MAVRKCPICNSKLLVSNNMLKCTVCGLTLRKNLPRKVSVFGISSKEVKADVITQKLSGKYFVIPLRGGTIIKPKSFQYLKTLLKKLKLAGVDYVCVDVRAQARKNLLTPVKFVPNELKVGLLSKEGYVLNSAYVITDKNVFRLCAPSKIKYTKLFAYLLMLVS